MKIECKLKEINRNVNGDYYFIYEIPKVTNHIKPGSKSRDEVLIVGIPKTKLNEYLSKKYPGSEIYAVEKKELYNETNIK